MAETKKNTFDILYSVDVSDHKEDKPNKNGKALSYLSWTWAWAEIKKRYPEASYEILRFEKGLPYVFDPETGYMVFTRVTIEGITHEMWLPVMDANNCAMKAVPYEVQTKYSKFTVKSATMFDVNKAIMRCLTKNLAMFGLGLYIYAGEDLPEDISTGEDQQDGKNASEKSQKASKTAKKDQEVKQPVQELPSDYCTICRLPVTDWDGKTKNGDPVHYSKEDIISRSTTVYGAPVCMSCMMKKQAKAKKQQDVSNE